MFAPLRATATIADACHATELRELPAKPASSDRLIVDDEHLHRGASAKGIRISTRVPDDPRLPEYVRTVMAVLEAGHVDKVCLSSDFSNQKYLRKNGGPGIAMVMSTIVPRLRQAGVNDATLHKILVENPRRVLAFVPRAGH